MSDFNPLDFYDDLEEEFPTEVVRWCQLMGYNYEFEEIINAVELLYETGAKREELRLRRSEAWMLYQAFIARLGEARHFQTYILPLRACVLLFITRMALWRQCPHLLPRWHDMGRDDEDDQTDTEVRVGNLWSANFLEPNYQWDLLEMCPNRDHIISFNAPFQEFEDLQRQELRNGRLMMLYPLSPREKRGQRRWRGTLLPARDGFALRMAQNEMLYYQDGEEEKSD